MTFLLSISGCRRLPQGLLSVFHSQVTPSQSIHRVGSMAPFLSPRSIPCAKTAQLTSSLVSGFAVVRLLAVTLADFLRASCETCDLTWWHALNVQLTTD
jgi:hypothetical protein